MKYIQRKDHYNLETVDHAEDMQAARKLLAEYRLNDPYAHHYLSSRPCTGYWIDECYSFKGFNNTHIG